MIRRLGRLSVNLVFKRIALISIIFFAVPLCAQALEPMLKTLSARVVSVEADGSQLNVDFRHPATGKVHRLKFFLDNQSGFHGINKLQELRSGQVVNIDYVEGPKGRLLIRHLIRVRLSGPPAGLENFRGL